MNSQLKDHREIGRELDLFSFHEYAPGAIFWHPKGWTIYRTLLEYLRSITNVQGYQEISTPALVKSKLFEKSGHWKHFKENMFNFQVENEMYSLKPMNCPESTLVFSSKTRSYADLPLRLSEYGILHRNELTGVLGGAFRVRQFTIDDAHIFVRPDQIQQEIDNLLKLVIEVYKSLGFNPRFYLATKPDKAMGDQKTWDEAEADLEKALKDSEVKYDIKPKEGAFYGPKIDIHIDDSQGRDWQLATIQLDFQQPESMDIAYIDKDGGKKRPVMIHRGLTGSLERFIGILTEHFQGTFPVWLSPVQAIVLPLSDKFTAYAQKVAKELESAEIRVELDNRNETLQAKIRDSALQKIPYALVVGGREEETNKVAARTRDGKDHGQMTVGDFVKKIKEDIDKKS
ncbi:threonine--tRNA ligase [Candidatus Curtissbacteria bacterium RIFCSPHIGHO2_01_FULL_41_11]|uniref:Threonine--tRNA ligase n=1 Tax=Candidatus Curtissbacteria bacterium RIFCSPHIGHO2_01_FULL_41_11 TaxID=1797711 RepID=A0A1F5G8G7_9BACT|nr:MAG: threonine--tRNA ligase [Candidatus Curtissbacteria bacterium RIFCSPHIGHO2_01_FULL_41_11]